MKKLNSLLLSLCLLFSQGTTTAIFADSSGMSFSKPFIDSAKLVTPSVVSIKAELGKPREAPQADQAASADEFLERFFGISPSRREQKPRKPQIAFGSGFIVSPDGFILTNNHIIQDAKTITVITNDEKELTAKLIGRDPNSDIALIKVEASALPAITFADSSKLEVGEWVLAIGNSLGLKATVTTGIVSALERTELDITQFEEFIQTDTPINQGNSGGPLVNLKGQVVGMNTAIASTTGGYMGICFAIPSNFIQNIMQQLKERGKVTRGFLGVDPQPVTSELAKALGLDAARGALLAEVVPGTPASKAGLRSGDVVIKVDGQTMENAGAFKNIIASTLPGTPMTLEVRRGKEIVTLTATIEENKLLDSGEITEASLGLTVETLTPEIASQVGSNADKGVVITGVDVESQAAQIGLKRGHIIISINREEIKNQEEFCKVVAALEPGKPVLLQVKVGLRSRFVTLIKQ